MTTGRINQVSILCQASQVFSLDVCLHVCDVRLVCLRARVFAKRQRQRQQSSRLSQEHSTAQQNPRPKTQGCKQGSQHSGYLTGLVAYARTHTHTAWFLTQHDASTHTNQPNQYTKHPWKRDHKSLANKAERFPVSFGQAKSQINPTIKKTLKSLCLA